MFAYLYDYHSVKHLSRYSFLGWLAASLNLPDEYIFLLSDNRKSNIKSMLFILSCILLRDTYSN